MFFQLSNPIEFLTKWEAAPLATAVITKHFVVCHAIAK